eukprot:TRINITY_DN3050_c0_g1_i10.p2 TRINITY_DN3050_c0_g1~~TRINITY_DN3050_c0_g1_i10.p2  ORF type:complete len:107 (-),score=26.60 TRINITY_DN3050_c0_g1_i10:392-712(-)
MKCFFFFFFKQKTAYEMLRSLVGSEMCIRDRSKGVLLFRRKDQTERAGNNYQLIVGQDRTFGSKIMLHGRLLSMVDKHEGTHAWCPIPRGCRHPALNTGQFVVNCP